MEDRQKRLYRGANLNNTILKTYNLPIYLPDISEYVFCTDKNIWIHQENVKSYISKHGGLYLEDKKLIVNAYVYELEHNTNTKQNDEDASSIDFTKMYDTLPVDLLGIIIKHIVRNSVRMFYRMCLVSKKMKQLTQRYTDYTYLMSNCGIGRMDLEHVSLDDIDERVIVGILLSGNFAMINIICSDKAIAIVLKILEEGNPSTILLKELKEQIRCINIIKKSHSSLKKLKEKILSI